MTISYQRDVASSTAGGFTRLLFKWKGSLYKLIYRELVLFLSAFILLSMVYRQLLTPNQKKLFEMVVKYFDAFLNLVPLSFVLGFYVSYVASRWWQQFLAIPWPDKLFHSVACFVDGFDEEARMLRRSLLRYMNLALILVLRSISSAVKQRFPTPEHVVEAGFVYRIQEASKKGKLLNEYALETIMREFCEFRAKCGLLWCYDWVSIPMVYTQVVTLATYLFFIFTVIGRQKIEGMKKGEYMRSGRMPLDIDLYIPIFTILQFFFYMGLLKVAEQLINPFGDDDEDFELNWLVDRHMKASFLGCDILMDPDRIPPMVKDYYWDKQNCPIPYTEASMHFKRKTYKGSADDMIIPESKQHMVLPEIEEEEDLNQRHSKLSLTSLLLDSTQLVTSVGGAFPNSNSHPQFNRKSMPESQNREYYAPGNWRSNHQQPGSRRSVELLNAPELAAHLQRRGSDSGSYRPTGGSGDGTADEDEVETDATGGGGERRGSNPQDHNSRRGSRGNAAATAASDKKKGDKKRRRDKQGAGFVWKRMIQDSEDLPRQRTPNLGQSFIAVADQALQQPTLPPAQQQHTPYHPDQQQHQDPQQVQIPQQLKLANRPQRVSQPLPPPLAPPQPSQDNIPHTSTTTVNSRPVSSIETDQPPPLVPIQRQNPSYTEQNYKALPGADTVAAANGDGQPAHVRAVNLVNSYAAAPRRTSRKEGMVDSNNPSTAHSMASLPRTQSGSTERPPAGAAGGRRNISTDRGSHRSLSTGSRGGGGGLGHDRYTNETERSLRRANAYAAEPPALSRQISAPSSPIHFGASSENNPTTYSHQNVRYVPNTRPKE